MVKAVSNQSSFLRELDWQNVDSHLSLVRLVSCPVDPMHRYWVAEQPFVSTEISVAKRLQSFKQLFEWAYGYHYQGEAEGRLKRRSPSAGALYPTEAFLVLETGLGWQVLYYHFVSHQFYPVPVQEMNVIVDGFGLIEGSEAILLVSVLWRTIQRYGVRGYRYCLLDAAHVASNLVQAAQALGHTIQLTPQGPTWQLQTQLELQVGEALVLALQTRLGALNKNSLPSLSLPNLPQLHPNWIEHSPLLSPILQRTISFHCKTLKSCSYTTPDLIIAPDVTPNEFYTYATNRYSAKDFTGEAVTLQQYAQVIEVVQNWSPTIQKFFNALEVYALTIRVENLPLGLFRLNLGYSGTPLTIFRQTVTEFSQRISKICQNQLLLERCAFILVLTARRSDIIQSGHIGYRHAILNAGFFCATLYLEALHCTLGTTTIGGYSDVDICHLIGDLSVYPIVVQAFGIPSFSVAKVDAARIVGVYQ